MEKKGREFWERKVRAWRESGQNQSEFSRENGINSNTFSAWTRRLSVRNYVRMKQKQPDQTGFVEIPLKSKEKGSLFSLEVSDNGEIVIRIRANVI
jgi:transposase-like protein